MPVYNSIAERILLLRARAARYKVWAEALYDRRIAAEVAGFADEIEAEAVKLERWQSSQRNHDGAALVA